MLTRVAMTTLVHCIGGTHEQLQPEVHPWLVYM